MHCKEKVLKTLSNKYIIQIVRILLHIVTKADFLLLKKKPELLNILILVVAFILWLLF